MIIMTIEQKKDWMLPAQCPFDTELQIPEWSMPVSLAASLIEENIRIILKVFGSHWATWVVFLFLTEPIEINNHKS